MSTVKYDDVIRYQEESENVFKNIFGDILYENEKETKQESKNIMLDKESENLFKEIFGNII